MAATITDTLKRELLDELYSSFTGKNQVGTNPVDFPAVPADNYWIGIGKAEEWTTIGNPPAPNPSTDDIIQFQSSLQSAKKVEDVSYVIPRVNWSPGSIYTAWDNNYSSDTTIGTLNDIIGSYYVITDQNNVYICIEQGMGVNGVVKNSTIKPTGTTSSVFTGGDGYTWKFMYNVGVFTARRYLTSNYIPVERVPRPTDVNGKDLDQLSFSRKEQYDLQEAAIPGQVIGIAVDSTGIGYPANSTISIVVYEKGDLNLSSALAHARTDNRGKIFQCVMKSLFVNPTVHEFGSGYGKEAWAELTASESGNGHGAVLRPMVCLDSGGMGADPRNDLNSSALMYTARLVGNEYKTFNVQNDFRQFGLIKNIMTDSDVPKLLPTMRGDAMKKLYVTVNSSSFDRTLIGSNAIVHQVPGVGAPITKKAIVDYYDSTSATTGIIHCHQNLSTGWREFDNSPAALLLIGAQQASVVPDLIAPNEALRAPGMDNFSGKVLYIDNRVAIEREVAQTEDIKIIIDL